MSSSKPGTKKRQGTEAPRKSKRLRSEEEEEVSWDFSQWAWQDTKKAPLAAAASSDAPVARWLGVQSLASIVTGKDGKVFVIDATSKRGLRSRCLKGENPSSPAALGAFPVEGLTRLVKKAGSIKCQTPLWDEVDPMWQC